MCIDCLAIHMGCAVRTNIDIDEALLAEAMAAAGTSTKKATVEVALRQLVIQHHRRSAVKEMTGLGWEGDLDAMREGRAFDQPK